METCFVHLHFVALVLDVASFVLCHRLFSGSPPLPCYVRPWRVALTARAQVKGSKGEPLLLYTDRSPRAWATHKRDTLLGQAQNGARAGGADFTVVTAPSAALPHDLRWTHNVGVVCAHDGSVLASSRGGQ